MPRRSWHPAGDTMPPTAANCQPPQVKLASGRFGKRRARNIAAGGHHSFKRSPRVTTAGASPTSGSVRRSPVLPASSTLRRQPAERCRHQLAGNARRDRGDP